MRHSAMTPALIADSDVVTEGDESAALTAWLDEQFAEQLDFNPQWWWCGAIAETGSARDALGRQCQAG